MIHKTTKERKTMILMAAVLFVALFSFIILMLPLTAKAEDEPPYTGLGFDEEDNLVYYTDGAVDTSYNGFAMLSGETGDRWFYVENGLVTFEMNDVVNGFIDGEEGWYLVRGSEFTESTTVAHNVNGWWYVKDGKVEFDYEGFAENENGTWYLSRGKVSFSYNGFAPGEINGENGWWYVEDSEVTFNKNDILLGEAGVYPDDPGTEGWWYVKNSRVDTTETVAHNTNGWWYVTGGKVDFDYNGFASNENGWWYLENGKVTFNRKDIILGTAATDTEEEPEEAWWYIKGSKVTDIETVAQNANGWWYVKDGKVDFKKNSVEQNENGWWYIHNGKVDFSYNGFEKNRNGWWYLENGKVTFKRNDILLGTAATDIENEPEEAWWYIKNSKVTDAETVAKNANGWWYVKGGKVDFTCTSVKQNENGWWRIVNGKVDFNCNSVEQNENGWWYIKNGKVDFSYNGLAKNANGWWFIKGGKVDFSYNGPAIYNGGGYHLINGYLDWNYSGTYSGTQTYSVKKGIIIASWVSYNGSKYFLTSSGKVTKETATINGRQEVFRMDGRWIDTSGMDNKAKSYSSDTGYLILVNLSDRVTKIYKRSGGQWTVAKNYLCTVGDTSKGWGTIKGDHYVGKSSWGNPTWKGNSFVDSDGHTLYYWVRFCDSFLFHSMLYDYNTYNLSTYGNDLGAAQSHGCVRLRFENAQWIYNNIPYGTRVIVY